MYSFYKLILIPTQVCCGWQLYQCHLYSISLWKLPILKGGIYRQVGDYFIPNLILPDDSDYQIGKYGRLRRNYLKEHRKILYTNYVVEGTLFKHLSEIDQACNERMEIIVPAMARQEGVTEALKAADQMEWVRRKNSIHSRAEEIVLHELVYDQ